MDAKKLKETITVEQIIQLMQNLGADARNSTNSNEVHFKTICHCGDSHKLYLYKDTKDLYCYSNCGHMDIINVIQNVKSFTVTQAINFICNMFGIGTDSMVEGFFDESPTSCDLEILRRYDDFEFDSIDMNREFNYLEETLLDRFYKYYHPAFYEDGISLQTLFKFGVKYDLLNERIIIPHRDEDNNLIAIRCRNLNEEMVAMGFKYMPITIDKKLLSAKTTKYLFGLNHNRENIIKSKRVILFEAEKAVMQLDTILEGNNIGLALMSSGLSIVQVELLKGLGIEEVVVALDKEFQEYGSKEEKAYAIKVKKGVINKLLPYFTVSIIWDKNGFLDFKDSPTDKGKAIFYKLFNERMKIQ